MDFGISHFGKMNLLNTISTYLSSQLNSPSNQNIGEGESNCDDKCVEKVFKWSEAHLSEMTCSEIHTLTKKT